MEWRHLHGECGKYPSYFLVTGRQRSCGKVMFSLESVILFVVGYVWSFLLSTESVRGEGHAWQRGMCCRGRARGELVWQGMGVRGRGELALQAKGMRGRGMHSCRFYIFILETLKVEWQCSQYL